MSNRSLNSAAAIPTAEPMPIAVRAFVPMPEEPNAWDKSAPSRSLLDTSEWSLFFDTETTTDARQALRFGAYLICKADQPLTYGLFYNQDVLAADEVALLHAYAERERLETKTVRAFVDEVFFLVGYEWRGTICGFNLPFDISRLAIRHASARGKTMHGGFSFTLSEKRWLPNVQVKHLNSRSSLIQFTKPPRKPETRGEWRKGRKRLPKRGSFIDIKTHAAALLSQSFNLDHLGRFLGVEHGKQHVEKHGGPLTDDYIGYCLNDVQTTYECYLKLRDKLADHGLSQTKPSKILSEAGIGKGYLREMGIKPLNEVRPDVPPALMGKILSAYYGGRAEVRWRLTIRQVLYCDFLSMYPTVCTLMRLFRFVTAKGFSTRDSTSETRAFVETIALTELQQPDTWARLATIVRVAPNADIFPVRAKYSRTSNTIGLNHLTSTEPLWFTLADVLALKLLTGRTPKILEAISFAPGELQDGLQPIKLLGKPQYRVDPSSGDFFKTVINLRSKIKALAKKETGHAKAELDAAQLALKILANSTSYGIFVEVNVNDLDKAEARQCFGPSSQPFTVQTKKAEEPGRYFHPLLATLITGAARLMLGLAEKLINDAGLDWAFCDTDSMAIAKPDDMAEREFFAKAEAVRAWFEPLNPYEDKGSLFKIEDQNFGLPEEGQAKSANALAPLYCLAISAKRYVLFNVRSDGLPIIRKASAHGLGHLIAPYGDDDPPKAIPAPKVSPNEMGVARWQHDLWCQIIRAVQQGHPQRVDLSYHPALNQPAASRYGATSPDLLRWFKPYDAGKSYRDQVKPFNFLIAFQAKPALSPDEEFVLGKPKRGRKPKQRDLKPIAPFSKDLEEASRNVFDRETGQPIDPRDLKTYREALRFYQLSPEAKFLDGDYTDRGRTERRHVQATVIECIGKEANKWEEHMHIGFDEPPEISYGSDLSGQDLDARLRELCARLGQRGAAELLGISRTALLRALRLGVASVTLTIRSPIIKNLRCDAPKAQEM